MKRKEPKYKYRNILLLDDNDLDHGINKDAEEKDNEIKKLREEIEILKNKLKFNILDANIEEEKEEEPQLIAFNVDHYTSILKDINDQQEWMNDYMKQTKGTKNS